jgi:NADPH-dependent 2,4-dienoyl-CoA reductase/sulfur reductase-like enzyme
LARSSGHALRRGQHVDLLSQLARVLEWIELIDPRGEHAAVQRHEQLGASLGSDHAAGATVSGVGSTLDQPGRFQVVEEMGAFEHPAAPPGCSVSMATSCTHHITRGRVIIQIVVFKDNLLYIWSSRERRWPREDGGDHVTVNEQADRPTVVVVGGGYGGTAVAKTLDEATNVVLVEPKDAFMHNVAALWALVDPSWWPRVFLPYDTLLANGRVVRDRAALVEPGRVLTASGEEISADYIVLATGSSYPFPSKTDLVDKYVGLRVE